VQYVYHFGQPTMFGARFPVGRGGQRFFRPAPGTGSHTEPRSIRQVSATGLSKAGSTTSSHRRNVRFRDVHVFAIDVLAFSTFFGGSDPDVGAVKGRADHLRRVRHSYRANIKAHCDYARAASSRVTGRTALTAVPCCSG
jgi:hypothetical protein